MIAGMPATVARQQAFQAKLAAAGTRPTAATAEPAERRPSRKTVSVSRAKTPIKSADSAVHRPTIPRERSSDTRVRQQLTPPPDVARRIRRLKTSTPGHVRRKIFQLAAERGLTLLDVWSDAANHSVTLVVDQNGYSETQFVIEHDKTTWRVTVYARLHCDSKNLLAEREALQARFTTLGLGYVALSLGRD